MPSQTTIWGRIRTSGLRSCTALVSGSPVASNSPYKMMLMCATGLALLATPSAAGAQTAQDHRGNRIEPFRQFGIVVDGRENRTRACSAERVWCAEILRNTPVAGTTLVISPGDGVYGQSPTYVYAIPQEMFDGGGVSLWDRIIVEADGAVMVGLDFSKETRRDGFRSYQRRLVLLRAGPGASDLATPVLEAPLSGHTEVAACAPSDTTPDLRNACENRFDLGSLFTVVPSLGTDRAGLIMVVNAQTTPGRRSRTDGLRAPIERAEGDEAADPECTYTRTFNFSEVEGRFVPDAPLPACLDFLEP